MEKNEEIEKLRNRVEKHSLTISRVPEKTKLKFKEIALDYCDDWGLTLKALIDHFISQNYLQELLAAKIIELEQRLDTFEGEKREPRKNFIKTIGGKKIEKGESEDDEINR